MGKESLWYKDAIIYELHVRSFYDANSDGIGDFRGLTKKLEYLANLGINTVWLLPFYPSPLKDDGYDISDYFNVHPYYGTLRDFKEFLKAAHSHGIRVITELVLNHTSDTHEWFQRARQSRRGSPERDFYVWSRTPRKYKDARIIFKDFETSNWKWDPLANAYYWHRFYSHQPDLNYQNPLVKNEIFKVVDFWFGMGVDGIRLDAIPYLFEREGTNCENLPETHKFLKELRQHIDDRFEDRMLLAEANQWPEDAVAYFGKGDECHMAFNFPVMPRLFMAISMEDQFPVVDIIEQTPPIPENCQWSLFLRNHDELTLEMVTDEERDYMYNFFARDPRTRLNLGIRRRLAPLMANNRRKIELMNILLFSLPGTPAIYYGDEIGMGDNHYLGDRNGVRTPMQWSPDRNAGFSDTNPQMLYLPIIIDPEYHYEVVNVENAERNLSSLLWWMRRVVSMRKRFVSFGRGDIQFIQSNNPKVLSFVRTFGDEKMLVMANLSRFSQVAKLDLSHFEGFTPTEVFSGNKFPKIGKSNYILTSGFNDYFWFSLEKEREDVSVREEEKPPSINIENFENFFEGNRHFLEQKAIPNYLGRATWFEGDEKDFRELKIIDIFPLEKDRSYLLILQITFREGRVENYSLAVSLASGDNHRETSSIICRILVRGIPYLLLDASMDDQSANELLKVFKHIRLKNRGEIKTAGSQAKDLNVSAHIEEQTKNEVEINFSNIYLLKAYRRIEEGINPETEVAKFLRKRDFKYVFPFMSSAQYKANNKTYTIAILYKYLLHYGPSTFFIKDSFLNFLENLITSKNTNPVIDSNSIGNFFVTMIELLGKRVGELHKALMEGRGDFSKEPFTLFYQSSLYQSMRRNLRKNFSKLHLNEDNNAKKLVSMEGEFLRAFRKVKGKKINCPRIRVHGNLALEHIYFSGKDFIFADIEGDPLLLPPERRIKTSTLFDVSYFMFSFYSTLSESAREFTKMRLIDSQLVQRWMDEFFTFSINIFLASYLREVNETGLVPCDPLVFSNLLNAYLFERVAIEVGREGNVPEWITFINFLMRIHNINFKDISENSRRSND